MEYYCYFVRLCNNREQKISFTWFLDAAASAKLILGVVVAIVKKKITVDLYRSGQYICNN